MGFAECLFGELGQSQLCPCTLHCRDSLFANLRNKGCVLVLLAPVWGSGAGPRGARAAGGAEPRRASCCGRSQLSPSRGGQREPTPLPLPGLKTCPAPGPGPLAGGAGSGEVPVSCSADPAVQEPVPKALTARASVSPGQWSEVAPGRWGPCCTLEATSWLGTVWGPGTEQRSGTVRRIRHNPGLGAGAKALGWAGGGCGDEGWQQPQPH